MTVQVSPSVSFVARKFTGRELSDYMAVASADGYPFTSEVIGVCELVCDTIILEGMAVVTEFDDLPWHDVLLPVYQEASKLLFPKAQSETGSSTEKT